MQPRRMAVEVDARDGAFAHADGRAAVAGDQPAQKLEDVGIVPHHQHALAAGVPGQQLSGNRRKSALRPKRRADLDLARR